jgi:hypothetical protein
MSWVAGAWGLRLYGDALFVEDGGLMFYGTSFGGWGRLHPNGSSSPRVFWRKGLCGQSPHRERAIPPWGWVDSGHPHPVATRHSPALPPSGVHTRTTRSTRHLSSSTRHQDQRGRRNLAAPHSRAASPVLSG